MLTESGYLIAWTAVGLVFYAMISLGRAVDLRLLGWDQAGPYIAGGVIAAAAALGVDRRKPSNVGVVARPPAAST